MRLVHDLSRRILGNAASAHTAGMPAHEPLTAQLAERFPGATFAWVHREQKRGCDFVERCRPAQDRLVFLLLDLSGKRETAAGRLEIAAQKFRRGADDLFRSAQLNVADAISSLALNLNRALVHPGDIRCAAAFLACYEVQTAALWYVNAGHTPGLVWDRESLQELSATGVPFGLFSHAIHDAQVTVLPAGSSFLLVSKGVIEMRARSEEFGLERVKGVLSVRHAAANDLCRAVLAAAEQFAASGRPNARQDRTALALVKVP